MHKNALSMIFIFLLGAAIQSEANSVSNEAKCISVLGYFSQKIEQSSVNSISSKLPDALIGNIKLTLALNGQEKLVDIKGSYSDEGLKSCLAIGIKKSTLAMIINATAGKEFEAPTDKYERCGKGMVATSAYYSSVKGQKAGSEMAMQIGETLGRVGMELRFLYPKLEINNYTLYQRVADGMGAVQKSQVSKLLIECEAIGMEYQVYLDALSEAKNSK
jgi:hypothetical protein